MKIKNKTNAYVYAGCFTMTSHSAHDSSSITCSTSMSQLARVAEENCETFPTPNLSLKGNSIPTINF